MYILLYEISICAYERLEIFTPKMGHKKETTRLDKRSRVAHEL